MKKIFILFSFLVAVATTKAQTLTNIFATGISGSYKCGHSSATARTDGSPTYRTTATGTTLRGYAVFDLSSIPAGSVVSSVVIGYNVTAYSGTGSTQNTYGYVGDLSTVTTAATLYANMVSGTLLNTTAWAAGTGNGSLATNATTVAFVQSNIGAKISVCFTESGGSNAFTFTGETGTTTTTGAHAPYIQITYCPPLAGASATLAPNPICPRDTLHLNGVGPGGTSFQWTGPSGFTSTSARDSITAMPITAADLGIYTFVVTYNGACHDTIHTAPLAFSVLPAITGIITPVCSMVYDTLTETVGHGTWSFSPAGFATVSVLDSTHGILEGTSYTYGTGVVTYTSPHGCVVTAPVTINPAPAPIAGGPANDSACMGETYTLTDTSAGGLGVWASSTTIYATISSTGLVNTIAAGTTLIYYTNPITGCRQQRPITVVQSPSVISGNYHVCQASIDTLTDSISGGVWTSSDPFVGTVATFTGWLTGYNTGTAVITYTLPGNCYATFPVMVTGAPGPIVNANPTCPGYTFTVNDNMPYGTWSSSNTSIATISGIDSVSATVHALTAGTVTLTYSSCGSDTVVTLVVNPIPAPIVGKDSVCVGDTIMMSDVSPFGIWQSKYDTVATAAAAFGIITGIGHGLDTIYYRLPNGCYTKKYVYVDSLPAPVTGNQNVCPFHKVTLSDITSGGKWTSMYPNIAQINIVTGSLEGLIAGFDTIIYKTGVGCKAFYPITVNPRPAPIVGDTIVCSYDSVLVTNITPNGFWTSTNTGIYTIDSFAGVVHTVDTSHDSAYIVYTIGATGCSDSLKIVKRAAPHPIIYYNGGLGEGYTDSIYLGHHIGSFQWFDSTTVGAIPGAVSCALAFLYNEAYFVQVVDTFGCIGRSETYFNTTAGVAGIPGAQKIVVYPNPVSSKLHILSPYSVDAEIYNAEGRRVILVKQAGSIDVSQYPAGEYIISLYDDQGTKVLSQHFVKE